MNFAVIVSICLSIGLSRGAKLKRNEVNGNQPTIGEILDTKYNGYYQLIKSVYLDPMLDDRDVTVFALSDATLGNLSQTQKDLLQIDLSAVYSMVLFQTILGAALPSSFFRDGLFLLTGMHNKAFLNIQNINGNRTLMFHGKRIIKTNIIAKRGIIHEIDGIPTVPSNTLTEYLRQKGNRENFLTALRRAQLLLPSGFTVFVPPDKSFWKITEKERMFLLGNQESNKELISMHIVPRTIFTSMIGNKPLTVPTIHRRYITLTRTKSGIEVTVDKNNADKPPPPIFIQESDIGVDNGIVHTINEFIRPGCEQVTVAEKLQQMNLTKFYQGIIHTHFESYLQYRSSMFTVFAPITTAFDNTGELSNYPSLNDRIVRFHIVPGKVLARNIRKFTEIQTMSGDMIMLRKFGGKSMASKGLIVKPDIEVQNGVVHLVDSVLSPRTDTVAYALSVLDKPSTKTFLQAMRVTGLQPLIANRRKFPNMFFVPTDEAFRSLPLQTRRYLFSNKSLLRKILRYHIVPGFFYSRLMVHKWVYLFKTRLRGSKLRIRTFTKKFQPKLMIYNPLGKTAQSVITDYGAINGVINIIDQILFPPGIRLPGVSEGVSGVASNIARKRA